ncbi:unnamed protein product [Dracunculus medinensis]|uniref:Uncharacterized protein n=1 Tax=Dracunculus medinensis TaxID=318479 RepID=A0A0N4UQZ7_DRAME|nr:unnamed protein product [Dracunculus medinensis]
MSQGVKERYYLFEATSRRSKRKQCPYEKKEINHIRTKRYSLTRVRRTKKLNWISHSQAQLSIRIDEDEIIEKCANVVEYLTNKLHIVKISIVNQTWRMNQLCQTITAYASNTICITTLSSGSEIEIFWKLEVIRFITKYNDRFRVIWPWKERKRKNKQQLSNNFRLCLGRLKKLVKRLQQESIFN